MWAVAGACGPGLDVLTKSDCCCFGGFWVLMFLPKAMFEFILVLVYHFEVKCFKMLFSALLKISILSYCKLTKAGGLYER